MIALAAVLLLATACWVLRVLLVAVVPADRLPVRVQESLEYLAPAVLASLVSVELVGAVRDVEASPALVIMGGMGLAVLVVRRTGSLALAVAVGATLALVVDLVLV